MLTEVADALRSRWRGWCLVAVVFCAGCQNFCWRGYQENHPRSLDQLFFEGSAARLSHPENTVAPYPDAVTGPAGPLDPQLPAPAAPPAPVARAKPVETHPTTGVRHVSAQTEDAGRVVQAQAISSPAGQLRVTEIFEDTDIRQAIQALATQAGVSVVIDEQVGGVTTALIENEPFELALRKILMPLGLVYRYNGGQYLIGTTDPASAMFPLLSEQYEYRPQHVSPQELLPLIPAKLQTYVRIIEKRNLLIVEAPNDIALRIVEQLQQVDEPVPQVLLEAMVCVFNPNETFQFNADMRQSLELDGEEVLDIGSLGLAVSGFVTPIGLENAFSDFAKTSVFLRLLAQKGYVTIRAAPRVMAKDGEKASISIQRETFFALQPADADIIFRQDVQKVDAGIVLDIVPVIRGDMVTVTIEKAEVSEDIRELDRRTDDLTSQFPLINRRQVSTTVHVKDGQTIVIGGLMQRQTVDRFSHVPYLSSIPLLGKLFERVEQEDKTAEVAIFISPRIIRPAHEAACPPGVPVTPEGMEFPAPTDAAAEPALAPPPAPTPPLPAPTLPATKPPEPALAPLPRETSAAPSAPPAAPATTTSRGPAASATAPALIAPAAPATIAPAVTPATAPEPAQPPAALPPMPATEIRFIMPKPAIGTTTVETAP
jgi:hypothetical protein